MVKDVIRNLRIIRERKNKSQEWVAEEMHKTQSSYARIERGATKIDLETLFKYAEVMGMQLNFCHIQPTTVLWCEHKFKPVYQTFCLFRQKWAHQ